MSVTQVAPSDGENITAHSTPFTTEVDQRIDTGPRAAWRREGAQEGLSFAVDKTVEKKQTALKETLIITW